MGMLLIDILIALPCKTNQEAIVKELSFSIIKPSLSLNLLPISEEGETPHQASSATINIKPSKFLILLIVVCINFCQLSSSRSK